MNPVKSLIGCRIKTHYGSGGVVVNVIGPYPGTGQFRPKGSYTINLKAKPSDKMFGILNTITVKDGVVLCEGIPLKILGRVADTQITLLDLLEDET